MATLNHIQFEIFLGYILPYISHNTVGKLAMVNTTWRDMCNNTEIWNALYLRLVHVGPKTERATMQPYESWCMQKETGLKGPFYAPALPFTHLSTFRCKTSVEFLNNSWCCDCGCMPSKIKNNLKSWREIRKDGIDTDNFVSHSAKSYRIGYNTKEYSNYVYSEWKKYNQKHGLSTKILCQDPAHYLIDPCGKQNAVVKYIFKKISN